VLADISLFESNTIGQNKQSQMSMFNSDLSPLFDQFSSVRQAADKCSDIVLTLQDDDESAILVGKIADAQRQYENELFSLRQKICKGIGEGLDDADRRAYLKLSADLKSEFQIDDPVLIRAKEIAKGIPKPTFNNDEQEAYMKEEFQKQKQEFIETVASELSERADTLEESAGLEYRNIVGYGINTLVDDLNELQPEQSEEKRLNQILKKLDGSIQAAEQVAQKPPLLLERSKTLSEDLKRTIKS
jgi:hypothetical protein